jgi:hypothetical protein
VKATVHSLARRTGQYTPERCAGCDLVPSRSLATIAVPVGYVTLTAKLCPTCAYQAGEHDARLIGRLAELAREVRR